MTSLVDYLRDKLEQPGEVLEPTQIGYLVTGEWCDRCGDTNYREEDRVCLTCTFPDDPCSRAFWEGMDG